MCIRDRRYPKLYRAGQIGFYFNMKEFWMWVAFGVWHGIICFYLPVFGMTGVNDGTGLVKGHWWVSTMSFCLIMHVITVKLLLETQFWNKLNIFIIVTSLLFYYICIALLCANSVAVMLQPQLNGVFGSMLGSARAWVVLLFIPIAAVAPDILYNLYKKMFEPTPTDKIMRLQIDERTTGRQKVFLHDSEQLSNLLYDYAQDARYSNNNSNPKNQEKHNQRLSIAYKHSTGN
eukprot:TRINITY_DN19790_c0_g1_i2.p1 TRINITY_DN19790_c0_g1~~TRINITY_DN19790_c0_g1_i2.p1  ORF type:complete len:255 (-),score=31.81 TRINITY_DN19790_c0_g1_i2:194-889(-)